MESIQSLCFPKGFQCMQLLSSSIFTHSRSAWSLPKTVKYSYFLWNCHLCKHWQWVYCLLPISMILKRNIATNLAKCNVAIITGINCPFSYPIVFVQYSHSINTRWWYFHMLSHGRISSPRSQTPGSISAGSSPPLTSRSSTRRAPTGPTPTLRWWTSSR